MPGFLLPKTESRLYRFPNSLGKLWSHLYGNALTTVLPTAAKDLRSVEVDWLRVKPVVKVIGEFWAQMTESDGNFRMLEFLEKEGAEVSIEPISTWVLYLLHERKARALYRRKMAAYSAPWTAPKRCNRGAGTLARQTSGIHRSVEDSMFVILCAWRNCLDCLVSPRRHKEFFLKWPRPTTTLSCAAVKGTSK